MRSLAGPQVATELAEMQGKDGDENTEPSPTAGDASEEKPAEHPASAARRGSVAAEPSVEAAAEQELKAELSGTMDELVTTRKALAHALDMMATAGIANDQVKAISDMLRSST